MHPCSPHLLHSMLEKGSVGKTPQWESLAAYQLASMNMLQCVSIADLPFPLQQTVGEWLSDRAIEDRRT